MGVFDKFVGGLRGQEIAEDDDNYFLDDDYQDDDYGYDDDDEPAARGSIFGKLGGMTREKSEPKTGGFLTRRPAVVENPGMQVTMVRPTNLDDAKIVCNNLLDGKAVVINLEGVNTDIAQRIIDFIVGCIYSIEGHIQTISKYIFMASPHNVELSGDFAGDFSMLAAGQASEKKSQNSNFNF